METPSSPKRTEAPEASGQSVYDLFDNSIEALERGLKESKQDANGLINAWLGPLREAGYPAVAFELERLQRAIRAGNVVEIRDSLIKSAHLSEDALSKADGMQRTKLQDLVRLLKAAAGQFE